MATCKSGLVKLDHDEQGGYGPETITLTAFHPGPPPEREAIKFTGLKAF